MSLSRLSGSFLVLGFLLMVAGALLYLTRGEAATDMMGSTRFVLERGFLMAAVIVTAVGLLLLEEYLRDSGGHPLVRIGAILYLFGGILIVAAEAIWLSQGGHTYSLAVVYVSLAFLGQAAIGAGLTRSSSLPTSIGWVTLTWSLAWLIILPIVTPGEMYFPGLHHLMPLIIGIALMAKDTPQTKLPQPSN